MYVETYGKCSKNVNITDTIDILREKSPYTRVPILSGHWDTYTAIYCYGRFGVSWCARVLRDVRTRLSRFSFDCTITTLPALFRGSVVYVRRVTRRRPNEPRAGIKNKKEKKPPRTTTARLTGAAVKHNRTC